MAFLILGNPSLFLQVLICCSLYIYEHILHAFICFCKFSPVRFFLIMHQKLFKYDDVSIPCRFLLYVVVYIFFSFFFLLSK